MGAAIASSRFGQVLSPLLIALLIDLSFNTNSLLYVIAELPVVASGLVLVFSSIQSGRPASELQAG